MHHNKKTFFLSIGIITVFLFSFLPIAVLAQTPSAKTSTTIPSPVILNPYGNQANRQYYTADFIDAKTNEIVFSETDFIQGIPGAPFDLSYYEPPAECVFAEENLSVKFFPESNDEHIKIYLRRILTESDLPEMTNVLLQVQDIRGNDIPVKGLKTESLNNGHSYNYFSGYHLPGMPRFMGDVAEIVPEGYQLIRPASHRALVYGTDFQFDGNNYTDLPVLVSPTTVYTQFIIKDNAGKILGSPSTSTANWGSTITNDDVKNLIAKYPGYDLASIEDANGNKNIVLNETATYNKADDNYQIYIILKKQPASSSSSQASSSSKPVASSSSAPVSSSSAPASSSSAPASSSSAPVSSSSAPASSSSAPAPAAPAPSSSSSTSSRISSSSSSSSTSSASNSTSSPASSNGTSSSNGGAAATSSNSSTATSSSVAAANNTPVSSGTVQEMREDTIAKIEDTNTPIFQIGNNEVPLFGKTQLYVWSLFNLIVAIASIILAAVVGYKILRNKRNNAKISKLNWLIILTSIITVILFFVMAQLSGIMVIFDSLSILFGALLVLEIATLLFTVRRSKQNLAR